MSIINNKEIIKYCKNYYKIINQEFYEDDVVAVKLMQIYQEYLFQVDTDDKREISLAVSLSDALLKYFEDNEYKKEVLNIMSSLKVKKDVDNILRYIVEQIVKSYKKYLEYYTRNLYIPRWI